MNVDALVFVCIMGFYITLVYGIIRLIYRSKEDA